LKLYGAKRYLTQKLNPNLLKNKKKICKFFTTPEPNGSPMDYTPRDYMNMFWCKRMSALSLLSLFNMGQTLSKYGISVNMC
jgi:hypothetical protein